MYIGGPLYWQPTSIYIAKHASLPCSQSVTTCGYHHAYSSSIEMGDTNWRIVIQRYLSHNRPYTVYPSNLTQAVTSMPWLPAIIIQHTENLHAVGIR